MTFRMDVDPLARLEVCLVRTRRAQQQILPDALERELEIKARWTPRHRGPPS
jgi:hypothetical protein